MPRHVLAARPRAGGETRGNRRRKTPETKPGLPSRHVLTEVGKVGEAGPEPAAPCPERPQRMTAGMENMTEHDTS